MKNLISFLFFIYLVMPLNIFATAPKKDTDSAEESFTMDEEKLKKFIQLVNSNNLTNYGGENAINLLNHKVLLSDPSIKHKNILEIGCGTGTNSNFMKLSGYSNIWGVDINEEYITQAKSTYSDIHFKVADVTKLTKTFNDEFFSCMYSFNIAHAVQDKVSMLQRLKVISEEGAILALFDYYLKDENYSQSIENIAGNKMYPLKLNNFKMMMQILGWEVIDETHITDKYKLWYQETIEKIAQQADMLQASGYTKEDINFVIARFQYLLDMMESDTLGGIILIAKKR